MIFHRPIRHLFLLTVLSGLLLLLGLLIFYNQSDHSTPLTHQQKKAKGDNHIPLKDRMDLAIQQEAELTRDPATNEVPRERLIAAYNYAEQLRAGVSQGRVAGAIPGMNWLERGPKNVGGRTRAIMVDPNDPSRKTVWSAGVGGGLWKTTDITAASPLWTSINDLFSNLAITSMAWNPANPLIMYFGTGEGFYNADAIRGNGIWKSSNGGNTWSQLPSTTSASFYFVQKVVVHPSGDVYAGTRSGLFRSQDGGLSFTKVLGSGTPAGTDPISDVEIAADNSIYAGIGLFSTDGVYKSATGNSGSWVKLNTGGNGFTSTGIRRIELACAPSNANTVYAVTQNSGYGISQILQTTNGGTSWTVRSNPVDADGGIGTDFTRGQAWYDLTAAVDPNNANVLFVGGVDLFKSTNGGSSWQQISHWYGGFGFQEVHADQHAIAFEPGSSSVIYFGNDGGIYRTGNGTASIPAIVHKSENYNVTQFYACAMNPTAYSSQFMAGAQDNGTQQYNSLGINATVEVTGGDGCFVHIDQNQPQYQFSSYVYNNYYRSTNSGASFSGMTNNNTGSFVNPTDYDDINNNLYASQGNGNYYVILNAPASNALTSVNVTAFGSSRATHISVSPNTANRVFFGIANGRIVRVDNANTTTPSATNITGTGMPGGSVSCIAIENGNDNHLLVTYYNYGTNSVWETTNGGASWTSVEGNLPDMPVRWALFDPANSSQAMIATEIGVWSTDMLNGALTSWGPSNNGLANVRTDMLQIRTSDNLVIAATHGRGLFSTDVFTAPYPEFVSDKRLSYTGKAILFTDFSYKAVSWLWDFGDGTTSNLKNPSKIYANPGQYTVTLQINGSGALTRTKTAYIHVLPNRGIPYNPVAGGNFDSNPLDFGSETVSGTAFERGNSTVPGKSGVFSGSNAWVTGVTANNYVNYSDSRLWTPNYNFTSPGIYSLKFYRKNAFEIGWDGFIVEYTTNKGDSWLPLGAAVTANWYDFANSAGTTSFPLNQAYFNATRSTYTLSQYDVSFLAGNTNVAFRIRFKSDQSVTAAGVAIDDFEITGPNNNPLPVELASFTGSAQDNHNLLEWLTLSEVINDRFEIERSVNGSDFQMVGTVRGNGTKSTPSEYKFYDKNIEQRNYYYRLKQIDINGNFKYSGTILIKRESSKGPGVEFIYPNPFKDELNVVFSYVIEEPLTIELFDLSGKKVITQSYPSSGLLLKVSITPGVLGAGSYFVKVSCGNKVYTEKLFYQR